MNQTVPRVREDGLPGYEVELEPKPEWHPRYPGSGCLDGKVALITGADSGIDASYMSGQVLHPNDGTIVNG